MQSLRRAGTEERGGNRDDSTCHDRQGPRVSRAGKDEQGTTQCVVRNQDMHAKKNKHWDAPEELVMCQKKQKTKRGREKAKKTTGAYEEQVSKSIPRQAVCPKNAKIYPAATPKLAACKESQQEWATDLFGRPDTPPEARSNVLSTIMRVRGSEGANVKTGSEQREGAVSFQNPAKQAAITPTSAISRERKQEQPTSECQWQLPLAETAQQQQHIQSGPRTDCLHSPDIPGLRPAP